MEMLKTGGEGEAPANINVLKKKTCLVTIIV